MTNRLATLIAVVAATLILPACQPTVDVELEKKSVQQVFEQYLESVKTADLTLAAQVWSQGADVAAVTPFGRFKGWEGVRDSLYVAFLKNVFIERSLVPANVAISVSGNVAWVVFDWTFTGKFANGQSMVSKGWESHVYQKTGGRWAIVQLHYSVPPAPPPR